MGFGTHGTGRATLIAACLVTPMLLSCGAASESPQGRLFDSHNLLLHAGFHALGPISSGQISEEEPQTLRATFERESCYVLAAFGTEGLDDIGISIMGPDESSIAEERGSGRTAVVSFCTEQAGEHHVSISAESGSGDFQMTYWRGDAAGSSGDESGGNRLVLGRAVTGNLVQGERFVDYTLEVRQARVFTIALESSAFDTYLYLLRNGIEIDRDDDGGSRTNSRITIRLEPGSYVVRVGAFMNRGDGPFTLVVR